MPAPYSVPTKEFSVLRHQCDNLGQWIFTDFEQAEKAVQELEKIITPATPFDIRLAYYQHRAFLENQWHHFDLSLQHYAKATAILESLAEPLPLAEIWLDVAAVHLNRRDWPAVHQCLDRARRYLGDMPASRLRALLACREGFLQLHLNNLRDALNALQEAEKGLLGLGDQATLKDYYILTLVMSGLGDLYERLDEKENNIDVCLRIVPIVEQHRLRARLPWHYMSAGRAALALNDTDYARECFENVIQYAGKDELEPKAHALANLGILALLSDDSQRAAALFEEADAQFPNASKQEDFTNLCKMQAWRARMLAHLEDYAQAEVYYAQAFANGLKGHDLNQLAQVAQALADLCAHRADFQQAYHWQQEATALTDRHYQQVRDRERQELEARHDLERSRQEAQMAKLRVAGLQLRALRAQMNPHFLFNALNAIQGLISSNRNDEAETYLARFAKMMRHTLDYSDLEVVSLDEEVEFIKRYLELNRKLRFRDKLEYQVIPPPGVDTSDLTIPTMIVQPFVENAIEHGLRPRMEGQLRIEFHLSDDERTLHCIIEDDGVGYNKGKAKQEAQSAYQSHRSRGMEITRERLSLLHQLHKNPGTHFVKITDLGEKSGGKSSGTRVEVQLPVLEYEE